jgi:glycerate 2-kinase
LSHSDGTTKVLAELYRAATAAADPGPALFARLAQLAREPGRRIWILALGKAAHPMAGAATRVLSNQGLHPTGGLIIAPAADKSPHPALTSLAGDHPEPGARSFEASDALAITASQVRPGDEVWVLLSGGTSSLIGAPERGLTSSDLTALYTILLGSGLDIATMNRIRKRFSRWGGGKLARAMSGARVRVYIVSDVIGDDLAAIGSGPCVPDPTTASEVRATLESADLWRRIPEATRQLVHSAEAGRTAETPKPGDQAFARVTLELVASNRLAVEAAARRAAELGLAPHIEETPLAGEAAAAGASVAAKLLYNCAQSEITQPKHQGPDRSLKPGSLCLIWGGETTVSLGEEPSGLGGRSQELALAAARELSGKSSGVALLAAGTDGRDGPTDAAGAIVNETTWAAIAAQGRDPERDLAAHDAYHALDSVGALLRPGLTGTNVMDVVIGICS